MPKPLDDGKLIYLLNQIEQTCEATANKNINPSYGHERVKGYIQEALAELNAETLAQTTVRLEAERKGKKDKAE